MVVRELRKSQGEVLVPERVMLAVTPNNGEGFSPVALTGEKPVTKFVADLPPSLALFFQFLDHSNFRF